LLTGLISEKSSPTTDQLFDALEPAPKPKREKKPPPPTPEEMFEPLLAVKRVEGRLVYTAEEVLEAVGDAQVVFIDTETSSLRPHRDGKIMAGIGFKGLNREPVYLPVRHADSKNAKVQEAVTALLGLLGRRLVFHNPKFDVAVLYYDGINLIEEDILDTVVIMRLVIEDLYSYELKELGSQFVREDAKEGEKELKLLMRKMGWKTYDQIPAPLILQYVLMDLVLTEGLYNTAMPLLLQRAKEDEGRKVAHTLLDLLELEQKVTRTLFRMELAGFQLDRDFVVTEAADVALIKTTLAEDCFMNAGMGVAQYLLGRLAEEEATEEPDLDAVRLEVFGELGSTKKGDELILEETGWLPRLEFNINSPHHIRRIFHAMGRTSSMLTEKGAESWGKVALEKLDDPLANLVVQWRAVDMVSRYYDNFLELMGKEDDVVHGSFHQAGTKSGRLSCREPNLQNIPRFEGFTGSKIGAQQTMAKVQKAKAKRDAEERAKDDRYDELNRDRIGFDEETAEVLKTGESGALFGRVRGAFLPRPGHFLLLCDWSQIELRIFADYAGEAELLHTFDLGLDIHRLTALAAFGSMPEDEESLLFKWVRNMGKQIAFGLLYGMGIPLLAAEIGKSEDEAQGFMDAYFARFTRARKYIDLVLKSVLDRGGHDIFWREGCNPRCKQCSVDGSCVKGCRRCAAGWFCHKGCEACRRNATGWVRNKYGRRRYLTKSMRYKAVNFLVQGTAADLLKEAMVRTEQALIDASLRTKMISTVHDELIFEVPYDEAEAVVPVVVAAMNVSDRVGCKLRVDVSWTPTRWSEKHALKCPGCGGSGLVCNKPKDELLFALYKNDKRYLEQATVVECDVCGGVGYDLEPIRAFRETGELKEE